MNKTRISIVVPAFNEGKNLCAAIKNTINAVKAAGNVTVEILIVNDGSKDGTAALIDKIVAQHSFIRAIHHEKNKGFGACFLSGLEAACYEWITLFPGDNCISILTLTNLLKNCGKADVVCAYTLNTECRTRLRNILSAIFSFIYATTFNVHLRYINATPVYPVAKLRSMALRCFRYSFPSETTVRLLRSGCTFMEIQGLMNPGARKSSALRIRNLTEAIYNYLSLIYEIYFEHRKDFAHAPTRILVGSVDRVPVDGGNHIPVDSTHNFPLNDQPFSHES